MSKPPSDKILLRTDREGGLILTPEFMREAKVKSGDEYAAWKFRGGYKLVFLKHWQGKGRIPKHAHRGKVEPALPELPDELSKPAPFKRQQACKDLRAMGPGDFRSRKPAKKRKSTK